MSTEKSNDNVADLHGGKHRQTESSTLRSAREDSRSFRPPWRVRIGIGLLIWVGFSFLVLFYVPRAFSWTRLAGVALAGWLAGWLAIKAKEAAPEPEPKRRWPKGADHSAAALSVIDRAERATAAWITIVVAATSGGIAVLSRIGRVETAAEFLTKVASTGLILSAMGALLWAGGHTITQVRSQARKALLELLEQPRDGAFYKRIFTRADSSSPIDHISSTLEASGFHFFIIGAILFAVGLFEGVC